MLHASHTLTSRGARTAKGGVQRTIAQHKIGRRLAQLGAIDHQTHAPAQDARPRFRGSGSSRFEDKLRGILHKHQCRSTFHFEGEGIESARSDMWKPYLRGIRERCTSAFNILDRFHFVAKINHAVKDVRAAIWTRLPRKKATPLFWRSMEGF
ncbi:transposase [Undibacterium sp. Jales W-56]|uniref:transposase n=1 Tax=Undibacterium sp. Jales W-56 TaxID=2897325 RepID=UPI0021D23456|nr:transposase [Undibacterium sp. Jales W-56]MCU6435295.1 transposase [Undibacterium sp. Jales W-56]